MANIPAEDVGKVKQINREAENAALDLGVVDWSLTRPIKGLDKADTLPFKLALPSAVRRKLVKGIMGLGDGAIEDATFPGGDNAVSAG